MPNGTPRVPPPPWDAPPGPPPPWGAPPLPPCAGQEGGEEDEEEDEEGSQEAQGLFVLLLLLLQQRLRLRPPPGASGHLLLWPPHDHPMTTPCPSRVHPVCPRPPGPPVSMARRDQACAQDHPGASLTSHDHQREAVTNPWPPGTCVHDHP
ncbi:basic proline-rich protein-like isoform X1 [Pezoporus occidentalis]|uniref:basic proline-rich protein-like isoform X1 n=2 Tax=Pezoporus occidentalis TaxID=407982 RepID=UPI002F908058